ncbi:MAG: UbiA family prenyltransferase [Bacteroidota bacterium]
MKKSTLLHLRIPFSFFLLPIFLFAWAIEPEVDVFLLAIVFLIIHFLLYPASNVYNSYFDKDEESIGGLKEPPKVSKEMYWYALIFDAAAVILGLLFVNFTFALLLFIYGLVSKAYSHPAIRLKRYAWVSWFIAGLFQGYFTFLMSYIGLHDTTLSTTFDMKIQLGALLSSLMLWGSYPMTQIYQHKEDARRGDRTLSLKLGIVGTFHFVMVAFALAAALYVWYFLYFFELKVAFLYIAFLLPLLIFFFRWYLKVLFDRSRADFQHTMRLNLISGIVLNLFFLLLAWWNYS